MPSLPGLFSSLVSGLWGNDAQLFEIPKQNTLAGLPVELLLSIADFLPQVDAICISLCNNRLFDTFHRRNHSILPSGIDKLPLLKRLERDLPSYFICYTCHLLHKYDASQDFGPRSIFEDKAAPLSCLSKWSLHRSLALRLAISWREASYVINFFHLQLAMRGFYHGPQFGISTEAICYTQVQHHPGNSASPEKITLFSIDAQICCKSPGLVLRTQEIMSVSGDKQYLMYCNPRTQPEKIRESPLTMVICLHIHLKELAGLINPVVKAYRAGKKAPRFTYTCGRCHTDFRIEMCEYGTELALIITRWFNLGDGLSPDDPRWKRHARLADRVHTGKVRRSLYDGENSPPVCFENASPRSLAALRPCNLSYLENERYKKVMYETWLGGLWYTPRKSSWFF